MENEKNYVDVAYEPIENFIIIGLTGRCGSGCSTAREYLCDKFDLDKLSYQTRSTDKNPLCSEIDFNTMMNFAANNKLFPFDVIYVRDIITTFIMDKHEIFFGILKRVYPKNRKNKEAKGVFNENEFNSYFEQKFGKTFGAMCKKSKETWAGIENDVYAHIKKMEKENYDFLTKETTEISTFIHDFLKDQVESDAYTVTYQHIGSLVRKYGQIPDDNIWENDSKDKNSKHENIFSIIKRINLLIKIMRRKDWICTDKEERSKKVEQNPLHLVIDSIKNVYEAYYMQARYGSFYLMGITVDDGERKQKRLKNKKFSEKQIEFIDYREQPSMGQKAYNSNKQNRYKKYLKEDKDGKNDYKAFLRNAYRKDDYLFYLQDVDYCIQNADILINNPEPQDELKKALLRYVCLMVHPGLVPPTIDERNMQIAQAAKLNSGCISRQVGAVVCDKNGAILSIGWNDPSAHEGNECFCCVRRNLKNLAMDTRFEPAYSFYELNDAEFRNYLSRIFKKNTNNNKTYEVTENQEELSKFQQLYDKFEKSTESKLKGLSSSYCFKDLYQDMKGEKNQVHTRAQHGEEKALEGCDKSRTKGGTMYSTSSSCELCAKKALSYSIRRIVYIEPYSGLTNDHILGHSIDKNHGEKVKRIGKDGKEAILQEQMRIELFTGATQRAYCQLYSPIFPLKDELKLRGIKLP